MISRKIRAGCFPFQILALLVFCCALILEASASVETQAERKKWDFINYYYLRDIFSRERQALLETIAAEAREHYRSQKHIQIHFYDKYPELPALEESVAALLHYTLESRYSESEDVLLNYQRQFLQKEGGDKIEPEHLSVKSASLEEVILEVILAQTGREEVGVSAADEVAVANLFAGALLNTHEYLLGGYILEKNREKLGGHPDALAFLEGHASGKPGKEALWHRALSDYAGLQASLSAEMLVRISMLERWMPSMRHFVAGVSVVELLLVFRILRVARGMCYANMDSASFFSVMFIWLPVAIANFAFGVLAFAFYYAPRHLGWTYIENNALEVRYRNNRWEKRYLWSDKWTPYYE